MRQRGRSWQLSVLLATFNAALFACIAGTSHVYGKRPIEEDGSWSLAALQQGLQQESLPRQLQHPEADHAGDGAVPLRVRGQSINYQGMIDVANKYENEDLKASMSGISGPLTEKANNAAAATNDYVLKLNNLHESINNFQGSVNRLREANNEFGLDTYNRLDTTANWAQHEAETAGRLVRNMENPNKNSEATRPVAPEPPAPVQQASAAPDTPATSPEARQAAIDKLDW
mmetsp:Transcript_98036/g.173702  ORF Transcript_98036/g.173702 Transcript_98036/m.173702 type:complete len:230 (+) Transcript_98036:57-746(+)